MEIPVFKHGFATKKVNQYELKRWKVLTTLLPINSLKFENPPENFHHVMLKEKIRENSTLANNDKGKSEVATSFTRLFLFHQAETCP